MMIKELMYILIYNSLQYVVAAEVTDELLVWEKS